MKNFVKLEISPVEGEPRFTNEQYVNINYIISINTEKNSILLLKGNDCIKYYLTEKGLSQARDFLDSELGAI